MVGWKLVLVGMTLVRASSKVGYVLHSLYNNTFYILQNLYEELETNNSAGLYSYLRQPECSLTSPSPYAQISKIAD